MITHRDYPGLGFDSPDVAPPPRCPLEDLDPAETPNVHDDGLAWILVSTFLEEATGPGRIIGPRTWRPFLEQAERYDWACAAVRRKGVLE